MITQICWEAFIHRTLAGKTCVSSTAKSLAHSFQDLSAAHICSARQLMRVGGVSGIWRQSECQLCVISYVLLLSNYVDGLITQYTYFNEVRNYLTSFRFSACFKRRVSHKFFLSLCKCWVTGIDNTTKQKLCILQAFCMHCLSGNQYIMSFWRQSDFLFINTFCKILFGLIYLNL